MLPTVVPLFPAGQGVAAGVTFEPSSWPQPVHTLHTPDGLHLIIGEGPEEQRLWLPRQVSAGTPLAALIAIDRHVHLRADAVLRLRRAILGADLPNRLTRRPQLSHDRMLAALRAYDAYEQGASYREVAEALLGKARVKRDWTRTSSLRDATIHLVRRAKAFVRGGYRDLLGCRNRRLK